MSRANKAPRNGNGHCLSLEQLERRDAPVIGLAAFANVAALGGTGGDYDGVVPINRSDFGAAVASGAILSTPMYILTAAHVVGKDKAGALDLPATAVEFSSQRTGGALGTIRVEVPGGADFLSVPQAPFAFPWDHRTGKQADDADIGIIALPDQNVATRTADRVMIAPYRATPARPAVLGDAAGRFLSPATSTPVTRPPAAPATWPWPGGSWRSRRCWRGWSRTACRGVWLGRRGRSRPRTPGRSRPPCRSRG